MPAISTQAQQVRIIATQKRDDQCSNIWCALEIELLNVTIVKKPFKIGWPLPSFFEIFFALCGKFLPNHGKIKGFWDNNFHTTIVADQADILLLLYTLQSGGMSYSFPNVFIWNVFKSIQKLEWLEPAALLPIFTCSDVHSTPSFRMPPMWHDWLQSLLLRAFAELLVVRLTRQTRRTWRLCMWLLTVANLNIFRCCWKVVHTCTFF